MKPKRRIHSLSLCLIMAVGFASCSSRQGENTNDFGEALVQYRAMNFPAARVLFLKALNAESQPEKQAEILVQIGHTWFYEKKYPEALENYGKVLVLAGSSDDQKAHAQLYIAACAFQSGDMKLAAREYAKVATFPSADLYYRRAAEFQIQKTQTKP